MADNIFEYFSYFSEKIGFDIKCNLSPEETLVMKCQTQFLVKIRKMSLISYLPSAESGQGVVKVN